MVNTLNAAICQKVIVENNTDILYFIMHQAVHDEYDCSPKDNFLLCEILSDYECSEMLGFSLKDRQSDIVSIVNHYVQSLGGKTVTELSGTWIENFLEKTSAIAC